MFQTKEQPFTLARHTPCAQGRASQTQFTCSTNTSLWTGPHNVPILQTRLATAEAWSGHVGPEWSPLTTTASGHFPSMPAPPTGTASLPDTVVPSFNRHQQPAQTQGAALLLLLNDAFSPETPLNTAQRKLDGKNPSLETSFKEALGNTPPPEDFRLPGT